MASKQAVGRAVRERLSDKSLLNEISRSLKAIAADRPLDAEPDETRKVRRVQAVTGLGRATAEAVANYADLDKLDLDAAERTGAEAVRGRTIDFVGSGFLAKGALVTRAVCRIAFREGPGEGTGFLISDRLLITNNHVIGNERAALGFFAEFDYELDLNRKPKPVTRFELDPAAFFLTDEKDDLDYSIVALGQRVSGAADPRELGCCPLSGAADKHALGEYVNIVQHPDARLKEIVVRENMLVARQPFALHYLADTEGGSSGSPVFNDQWEVVALHHWGVPHREVKLPDGTPLRRDVNEGIRISAIVHELETALRGIAQPHQQLLETALRLGAERRESSPIIVESGPARGNASTISAAASGARGTTGLVGGMREDGVLTLQVPVEITVAVGARVAAPAMRAREMLEAPRDERPVAVAPGAEKLTPDGNYRRRSGYKRGFLPGHEVAMPVLSAKQEGVAARNNFARDNQDPFELKYTHFSVKLNGKRRLAFFTATNIDGKNWKHVDRKTGKVTAPEAAEDEEGDGSEAREPWFEDPRVDDGEETNDDLYLKQTIDGRFPGQLRIFERGHLTRRQDPAWGSDEDALAADADTFHFTNCTPQIGFFNEGKSKRGEEARRGKAASGTLHWRAIEDYVLENAKAQDLRVSVFTGPVLNDDDDIPWREDVIPDFKVPREFWKVVLRVENGELLATALCADQSPLIDELPEARRLGFRDLSKVKKYQISIEKLQEKTGLDFGDAVRRADTFVPGPEGRSQAVADITELTLDKPAAEDAGREGRRTRRKPAA